MSDDKITQIEIRQAAIETEIISIKSDIRGLKAHDEKTEASQEKKHAELVALMYETQKGVYRLGDQVLPMNAQLQSHERKIGELRKDHGDFSKEALDSLKALQLSEASNNATRATIAQQNAEQLELLKILQLESVAGKAVEKVKDKQIARIPIALGVCTALLAVLNWYFTHR